MSKNVFIITFCMTESFRKRFHCLSMYALLLTPGVKRVKNCSDVIFRALWVFLMVLLGESISGPVSNV